MTNPAPHLTEDGLAAIRDRPLTEAYAIHDVGMAMLQTRLEAHGLYAVDHGDDKRHSDEIIFADGPDLAIYREYDDAEETSAGSASATPTNDDEEDTYSGLVGYIEVKTKESEEWFGRCNRRHYNEYVNFAAEVDVPIFIWFALVDADESICKREGFFEVRSTDDIDGEVVETTDEELVFYESDTEVVSDSGDETLLTVDGNDLVGVRRGDQIVEEIPSVHGNDVVCLNEDKLRSTAHVLHRL